MARPPILDTYRNGPPGSTRTVAHTKRARLHLVYDETGELAELGVVRNGKLGDRRIYFGWRNGTHAFKTRMGVGGIQWSAGRARSGTVYDDDGGGGGDPGHAVDLPHWVAECVTDMVHDDD